MFPLRDNLPSVNKPVIIKKIIFYCFIFFIIQSLIISDKKSFFNSFGLVPSRDILKLPLRDHIQGNYLWTYISHMFLHGSFAHLIGNMWTLWIFGDNVEDKMGVRKFTVFYALCGLCAVATHIMFAQSSSTPIIGASGAVSGIMGAYFIMFPRAKVLMFFPVIIIPFFFHISAAAYLGIWFLMQFIQGSFAIAQNAQSAGIAWWAHIGGFIAGILLHKLFLKPQPQNQNVGFFVKK